jgi:hypothetical protein
MLEFIRSKIGSIEEVFGKRFLEDRRSHPIRDNWREATRFLFGLRPGQQDLFNTGLAFTLQFAKALELTRSCPNFDVEVRKRLEKRHLFDGACYEMLSAAAFLPHSKVEFMRSHGNTGRPGDILVTRDSRSILVECTRKMLVTGPLTDDVRSAFRDDVGRIRKQARDGSDILVTVLGSDPKQLREILREAETVVASGKTGLTPLSGGAAICITVDGSPPIVRDSGEGRVGFFFPEGVDLGEATANVELSEGGALRLTSPKNIEVRVVDSHSFDSIVSSFGKKIGKSFPDGGGVINIDLDVSRTRPEQYLRYPAYVSLLLGHHAWSARKNTHIGGFVLTVPIIRTIEMNGWKAHVRALCNFCRNRTEGFLEEWLPRENLSFKPPVPSDHDSPGAQKGVNHR